jgi:hypothetical protein
MVKQERIRGRLIEIQVPSHTANGWVAVAIVVAGLPHEKGMLFEAKGTDALAAENALRAEVERYFAS